ncbi:MAG: cadherin-like domain-containing protein, partial [Burkholderiales bacterium]|nr:cadherin-like domain-containing protein [Anaerolineae bacterium]
MKPSRYFSLALVGIVLLSMALQAANTFARQGTLVCDAIHVDVAYERPQAFTLPVSGGMLPYDYTIVDSPDNGVLSGTEPDLTFTPDAGFIGTTAFNYSVSDADGASCEGTISISVYGPLHIEDATFYTNYETPINIFITITGGLPPNDYSFGEPAHGELIVTENLTYIPDAGFSGVDTFTISDTDALGSTTTATMTIHVSAPITVGSVSSLIAAINTANANTYPDTIILTPRTYSLTTAPANSATGLPFITSEIAIRGNGSTITRGTTSRFRFFRVMAAGQLTLENLTLSGGVAKGGNSRSGGGGLGAGGAIFNQGSVNLIGVTLTDNLALGGSSGVGTTNSAGGGIG